MTLDEWYRRCCPPCDPNYQRGEPFGNADTTGYGGIDPFILAGTMRTDLPPPILSIEQARAAFEKGRYAEIRLALETHLSAQPEDTEARRLMALALLLDGEMMPGIDMLDSVIRIDPGLVGRPLDASLNPGDVRSALSRLLTIARRPSRTAAALEASPDAPSPVQARAYLAAMTLNQALGRGEQVVRLIPPAEKAGLSPAVVREFQIATRDAR